jgi:hypothetical protein
MNIDYKPLFDLFCWENRDHVYRVYFTDGDEYEITEAYAGQDEGEQPHATASVVRVIQKASGDVPAGTCIFFYLPEITRVVDPKTEETVFRTT